MFEPSNGSNEYVIRRLDSCTVQTGSTDQQMSQYVHDRFAEAGIPSVEIQPVDALLSEPVSSSLELLNATSGSSLFVAALSEDILEEDSTSDTWYRNHTFNGYVVSKRSNTPRLKV